MIRKWPKIIAFQPFDFDILLSRRKHPMPFLFGNIFGSLTKGKIIRFKSVDRKRDTFLILNSNSVSVSFAFQIQRTEGLHGKNSMNDEASIRQSKPSLLLNYSNVSCLFEHTNERSEMGSLYVIACVDVTLCMFNADRATKTLCVQLEK